MRGNFPAMCRHFFLSFCLIMAFCGAGCVGLRPLDEARAKHQAGRIVPVKGETIHLREWPGPRPDAPVVLLVHGFASSCETWLPLVPRLSRTHRVLAVDLPGFGLSSRPREGQAYSVVNQWEAVEAALEDRGVKGGIHLVGHSMGGFLSLRWAALHPERFRSVTAIAPLDPANPWHPSLQPAGRAFLYPFVRATASWPWTLHGPLKAAYGPFAPVPDGMARQYRDLLSIEGFSNVYFGLASEREGPSDVWEPEKITLPVALIWGQQDAIVPWGFGSRLADDLPDALLYPLKEGHMVHETSVDTIEGILRETWKRSGERGRGDAAAEEARR